MKILIVEDDQYLRQFVAWTLQAEGHEVSVASDGEKGLEMAQQELFDTIILDLRLPCRDGWSLIKELKASARTAGIPIVVFTATADISQKDKAYKMGAACYLVKPISANDLKECLVNLGLNDAE